MRVRIVSTGEYDRHEAEVRFIATVDGRPVHVAITTYALFIISESLNTPSTDPLVTYAASGRLLEAVVADSIARSEKPLSTYLITHHEVLNVTGHSGIGNSHVPNKWNF